MPYGDNERVIAEIYNQKAFDQKLLFSGMRYKRGISPTDLDLFLEFNSRLFIYGESKKYPSLLTKGQKSALEHLVDSHNDAGDKSIAIFFQHEISEPNPVYAKDQIVVQYYLSKELDWRVPMEAGIPVKITLHSFIEKVIHWCEDVKKLEL